MLIWLAMMGCPRRTIRRVASYVRQQVSTSGNYAESMQLQGYRHLNALTISV